MDPFLKLINFLNRLDDATLGYTLEHPGEDTIMVSVSADTERWEVEFYADGEVQVEIFYTGADSEAGFEGEEALERLFSEDDELEEDDFDDEYDEDDFDEDDDDEDFDEEDDEEDEDDDRLK